MIFIVAVLLTACMSDPKDEIVPAPAPNAGDAELVLVLDTPAGFNVATRALTVEEESVIHDVDVLVFDDEDILIGIYEGQNVSSSVVQPVEDGVSGRGSFKVTLPKTEVGKKVTIMVLANLCDDTWEGANANLEDTYDNIRLEFHGVIDDVEFAADRLPMWGEVENVEIKPGFNRLTFEMVRSVARIDVGVGAPSQTAATGQWTWNGKDGDGETIPFVLNSVHVIRPEHDYTIIPARKNRNPQKPDVDSYKYTVDKSVELFAYTANGTSGVQREIYIPESEVIMNGTIGDANHEERTAIVVGGSYNGGATTYYRLDFAKGGSLIDVLRNHLYQFNISKVTAPGFSTPAEAYASHSMNMTAEVLDWNETNMGNIWFDGFDFFGIDKTEGVLDWMNGSTCTFKIKSSLDFEIKDVNDGTLLLSTKGAKTYSTPHYKFDLASVGQNEWTLTTTALKEGSGLLQEFDIFAGRITPPRISVMQDQKKLPPPVIDEDDAPYILYWDDDSQTMALGAWGGPGAGATAGGKVTQANMIFTQLGSTVGFLNNNDAWKTDGSQIMFNPTSKTNATMGAAVGTAIPNWGNFSGTKSTNDGYISSASYHTEANVKNGFGDICKLVGLTAAQVKAGVVDNGKYRLPTNAEDAVQYGSGTEFIGTRGVSGRGVQKTGNTATFLPAAGSRDAAGSTNLMYNNGYYWSSMPYSATRGNFLYFGTSTLPGSNSDARDGYAVRCVNIEAKLAVGVSSNNTEWGTVTPSVVDKLAPGSTFTATATPTTGNRFVNWTVTGGVTLSSATAATTTVTVNGTGTLTANFEKIEPIFTNPTAPYILYWDSATSTMQVGAWGGAGNGATPGGKVLQENMIFAQFGSTVGFLNNNDAWAPASEVVFNPPAGNYSTYTNIPCWKDYTGAKPSDYNNTTATDGYISSSAYHTMANAKAGFGDICKLAGLTVADINAGVYDNKKYRLPKDTEYQAYGSGTTWSDIANGTSGRGVMIGSNPATFLPAAGRRQVTYGSMMSKYTTGYYWSSRPSSASGGYSPYFGYNSIMSPSGIIEAENGQAIRCVPQEEYNVTIVAGANGTVTPAGTADYHAGMVMPVTATANSGYQFSHWTVAGGLALSSTTDPNPIVTVNGSGSMTANFARLVLTNQTAPYILYWDGIRMQVGAWGSGVTQANMIFTQFGSTVGFLINNDAWKTDGSQIMFNPTSKTNAAIGAAYDTAIPNWNNYTGTKPSTYSTADDGYISGASYHTVSNVQAGFGDICKLAGLTASQVKAGIVDNKLYRLPTEAENVAQYGSGTEVIGTVNVSGYGIQKIGDATTFLPASGRINMGGGVTNVYRNGNYWSSRPYSTTNGGSLNFTATVGPSNNLTANYGQAVRCVPQ